MARKKKWEEKHIVKNRGTVEIVYWRKRVERRAKRREKMRTNDNTLTVRKEKPIFLAWKNLGGKLNPIPGQRVKCYFGTIMHGVRMWKKVRKNLSLHYEGENLRAQQIWFYRKKCFSSSQLEFTLSFIEFCVDKSGKIKWKVVYASNDTKGW